MIDINQLAMLDCHMTEPTDSRNYVTVSEAVALLGVSERTIYRRIKKGKLKAITQNDRTYVDISTARHPTSKHPTPPEAVGQMANKIRIAELEAEVKGLKAMLETTQANSEDWKHQAAALTSVISELKQLEAQTGKALRWQFWRKE